MCDILRQRKACCKKYMGHNPGFFQLERGSERVPGKKFFI